MPTHTVNRKNAYTTGDVAAICACSPSLVKNWIDSGFLPGFRVPSSKFRRVAHKVLVEFLRKHDVPIPDGFEN